MTTPFDEDPLPRPRSGWMASRMASLRASFLTGIVVIAPVGLTVWLIWTVIGWVDGFVWPFVPQAYQPEALLNRFLGIRDASDPDYQSRIDFQKTFAFKNFVK